MFVVDPFVFGPALCILSSPELFSLRKKRLIILHCVFDFLSVLFVFGYLWANCEAILPMGCARQRREVHTAGELYGRQ